MRQVAALGAFLALPLLAAHAGAAGQGEWSTGAAASLQFATPESQRSLFWDGQVEYGLSETFQLGGEVGVVHAFDDFAIGALRATPLLGVRLDIVQWVPYLASGPSLIARLEPAREFDFGADVSAGVDYLLSRSWALGGQYHFTATVRDGGALLHRGGLRLMYHWGW